MAASIGVFFTWVSIIYLLRISPDLLFYVRIVLYSIYDIRHFSVMLSLMIAAFSNAQVILDSKCNEDD
jgi:hypothetical protein